METSRPLIEARHHQLVLSIPPEPLTLEGDPIRLALLADREPDLPTDVGVLRGVVQEVREDLGQAVAISVRDRICEQPAFRDVTLVALTGGGKRKTAAAPEPRGSTITSSNPPMSAP